VSKWSDMSTRGLNIVSVV